MVAAVDEEINAIIQKTLGAQGVPKVSEKPWALVFPYKTRQKHEFFK